MTRLQEGNALLAFLLELALLGALCDGGFNVHSAVAVRVMVGVGGPIVVMLIWSVLAAPGAQYRLALPWLLVLKVALFALAVLVLILVQHTGLAIVFGALAALQLGLAAAWHQV